MPSNIEIKAHVHDPADMENRVRAIADSGPQLILQDDTFFGCEEGRLKLRVFSESEGELIFYKRDDSSGPSESRYTRAATSEPDNMRVALANANGVIGRVVKRRILYLKGRTRVHLDDVYDLGHFLELEVVLADDESTESGIQEADELVNVLGINREDLIDVSYFDLLSATLTAER